MPIPPRKRSPRTGREYDELDYSTEVCGAVHRHDPTKRCKAKPLRGRNRCRHHGGKSPRGVESKTWKGKGYSVHAPRRIADMLDQLDAVGDYVRVKEEIHLFRAHVNELLVNLDEGEQPHAWLRFQSRLKKIRAALSKEQPDVEDALVHLEAAEQLAADRQGQRKTWDAIKSTILGLQKLTDNERKVYEELNRTITPEAWNAYLSVLAAAVAEHVTEDQLIQIGEAWADKLLNHPFGDQGVKVLEVARQQEVNLLPPDERRDARAAALERKAVLVEFADELGPADAGGKRAPVRRWVTLEDLPPLVGKPNVTVVGRSYA